MLIISRTHLLRLLQLIALTASLGACSHLPTPEPEILNLADPLIGKIYQADGLKTINVEELLHIMADSEVIYLGETHDNTHQHQIQLDTIKSLVDKGLTPAIGFEFFSREHTSHLLNYMTATESTPAGNATHPPEQLLRLRLGWGAHRENDWQHFLPILQYAKKYHLPVFGADLSSGQRKRMAKAGYDGLTPVEKLLIPLSNFTDDTYRTFMKNSFTESHCGWGDDTYRANLYDTWLARNETMARSIIAMHEDRPEQPVVMILGGGHTEYNMAVYERTAHLKANLRQVNLRLLQVANTPFEAETYFEPMAVNDQAVAASYEYIWFTQRMPERPDPCVAFRKHKKQPVVESK